MVKTYCDRCKESIERAYEFEGLAHVGMTDEELLHHPHIYTGGASIPVPCRTKTYDLCLVCYTHVMEIAQKAILE